MKSMESLKVLLGILCSFSFIKHGSCIVNLADAECGQSVANSGRIINGLDAEPGEFPWIAAIYTENYFGNETYFTCGGVIIHRRFILTAGHCVKWRTRTGPKRKVVLGAHSFSEPSSDQQEIFVVRVLLHPHYIEEGVNVYNDIALLQLGADVVWTPFIRPACLPGDLQWIFLGESDEDEDGELGEDYFMYPIIQQLNSFIGKRVIVAGWGLLREDDEEGTNPDILQKVDLQILPSRTCQEWHKRTLKSEYPFILRETQLCAGFKEGQKDSCTGDSGGPLLFRDNAGHQIVVAVVSSGFGCGRPMLPGVYTRVSSYLTWIDDTINMQGFYTNAHEINSWLDMFFI